MGAVYSESMHSSIYGIGRTEVGGYGRSSIYGTIYKKQLILAPRGRIPACAYLLLPVCILPKSEGLRRTQSALRRTCPQRRLRFQFCCFRGYENFQKSSVISFIFFLCFVKDGVPISSMRKTSSPWAFQACARYFLYVRHFYSRWWGITRGNRQPSGPDLPELQRNSRLQNCYFCRNYCARLSDWSRGARLRLSCRQNISENSCARGACRRKISSLFIMVLRQWGVPEINLCFAVSLTSMGSTSL